MSFFEAKYFSNILLKQPNKITFMTNFKLTISYDEHSLYTWDLLDERQVPCFSVKL